MTMAEIVAQREHNSTEVETAEETIDEIHGDEAVPSGWSGQESMKSFARC